MFDLPLQLDNEIWELISFKINMKNYGGNPEWCWSVSGAEAAYINREGSSSRPAGNDPG